MKPEIVRKESTRPVEMFPGIVRRTLAYGDRGMLVETTLTKGADMPEHKHPHEQITYVLRGKLELVIDGEPVILTSGDSVLVPGNVPHSGVAHEETVVLDTFAPPREDYK